MRTNAIRSNGRRSLDDRIAAAFTADTTSESVATLIGKVETAAATADHAAQHARSRALDPALSAAEVAAARREMDDAAFRRERMQTAVAKLGERLAELKSQEEQARRRAAYDAAIIERDKLAAEMAEVYPRLANKLADLAARVDASDRELTRINTRALPNGAAYLLGAEALARGLRSYNDGTAGIPRVTHQLRLPAFEYDPFGAYAWPRTGTTS